MIKNAVRVFVKKIHEIVKVAVINDNNNFAPSLFRSLWEFVGDCFGPRYFSLGAALPQKNTSVQNNHLRFHTMTSKKMVHSYYCLSKEESLNQLFLNCCCMCDLGSGQGNLKGESAVAVILPSIQGG